MMLALLKLVVLVLPLVVLMLPSLGEEPSAALALATDAARGVVGG